MPTGYDKIKAFLQTVKSNNLNNHLRVRYNNKSLEQFLLDSKELGIKQKPPIKK